MQKANLSGSGYNQGVHNLPELSSVEDALVKLFGRCTPIELVFLNININLLIKDSHKKYEIKILSLHLADAMMQDNGGRFH